MLNPPGTEIPGRPAIFTGTVYISSRYISSGFEVFSPNLNAGFGAVGIIITSHFSNAFLKSSIIKVLTCCALL